MSDLLSSGLRSTTTGDGKATTRTAGTRVDVVVIGAGPYGLSTATHLRAAGAEVRLLGEPMGNWIQHMPQGMRLRSRWNASHIADPDRAFGLEAYEKYAGLTRIDPVPLERFIDYGLWYQRNAFPDSDHRKAAIVEPLAEGFRIRLDDGEEFRAGRVVVAAGIVPFAYRPDVFDDLPPELASHTADHNDLSIFAGRRVAVIGGGQSAVGNAALLHEAGAEPEVIMRDERLIWLPEENLAAMEARPRLYKAYSHVGTAGPYGGWVAASPTLTHLLPRATRMWFTNRVNRPSAAGMLKPRVADVPFAFGRAVASAERCGDRVLLTLDDGSRREVDHVMLATGYRIDVSKYAFLSPEIVTSLSTRQGHPVLRSGFESSVKGLHFLGASATTSYGPVLRFVSGTWSAARGVTRAVTGRGPRAGLSW